MAVDFAVPLITNIKCAKLFVEALGRGTEFEISSNDYHTSHRTIVLPGLINIQTVMPNATTPDAVIAAELSRAAVAGGFTMICNSAVGSTGAMVTDRRTISVAKKSFNGKSLVDYVFSLAATEDNSAQIGGLEQDVSSLFVEVTKGNEAASFAQLAVHFAAWSSSRLIVARASNSNLAAILFLATLHQSAIACHSGFFQGRSCVDHCK
ncbi:hypothetical protein BASA81_007614 [Batrachochytrium salamandrivorans]|nr:hypothetical protein BASA81_007614 [Batrachochytrium salamandrivorans]